MQSLRYFKSPTLMPTDILSIFIVIGFYPAKLRIFFEKGEDIERKIAGRAFTSPLTVKLS